MTHKISKVEAAGEGRQHGQAWNLFNEISWKKKSKAGQISCLTAEDRIYTWYTHFENLLANPPNVLQVDEDISTILTGVNIDDGLFTMQELKKGKMLPQVIWSFIN